MRVIESCAQCLFDKQRNLSDDKEFLREVKEIIDNRDENDTAPYLIYLFKQVYERRFDKRELYADIKRKYNDFVLAMEDKIRSKIERAEDPLVEALVYARIGNYIDFGAMNNVDDDTFLALFDKAGVTERDKKHMESFFRQCKDAKRFLLITDNCGEIVLDKLFLEQMKERYPKLDITVLVRGDEVLNDATIEDAEYVGLDKVTRVISNGNPVAGTIYNMLTDEAKEAMDNSDVILAKGQGNYESLYNQGRHIFYSFLCKCELFINRFEVPEFTGIFVEEME